MKIGILSDSHNEHENVKHAADFFKSLGVEKVIHCGDLTTARILDELSTFVLYVVFGNVDLDRETISLTTKRLNENNLVAEYLDLTITGKRIFIIHGDDWYKLDQAIHSGKYDYVFTGHTHQVRDEKVGKTRVINPGALGGKYGGQRSIAILDLKTGHMERYFVD